MSKRASPTVVGAFVLIGLGLALATIVILGGGRFFRHTTRMIVYFDGSVTGLRAGAPVRFRGIDIGSVHDIKINISGAMRDPAHVRIPVVIDLDESRLSSQGMVGIDLDDRSQVNAVVDHGLRAELAIESVVTGVRYVALDFRPGTPARFEGDRSVGYPQIPSTRSLLEQAPDKLNAILAHFSAVDFEALASSIRSAADEAKALLGSPHLQHALAGIDELTRTMNRTAANLNEATRSIGPLAAEWQQTARSAGKIVAPDGTLASQLGATLAELQSAARSMRRLADHLDRDPGAVVRGARQ
jgi:paraquat-inducible protein B